MRQTGVFILTTKENVYAVFLQDFPDGHCAGSGLATTCYLLLFPSIPVFGK